jgi:hypothetical protein
MDWSAYDQTVSTSVLKSKNMLKRYCAKRQHGLNTTVSDLSLK